MRSLLALLALLAGTLASPSAPASASVASRLCEQRLAHATAKLARDHGRILRQCVIREARSASMDPASCANDPRTARRLAAVSDRFVRSIAAACGGADGQCGTGDDVPIASLGWGDGVCPGVLGSGCNGRVTDCGEMAECIACSTAAAVAAGVSFAAGGSDLAAPQQRRCQVATTRATSRSFAQRAQVRQRCLQRARGDIDAIVACLSNADPRAHASLEQSDERLTQAVCRACSGAGRACGAPGTPSVGAANDKRCPAVTPPGSTESCDRPLESTSDWAECLACVTRQRADCAAAAAQPLAGPLPEACRGAPDCDPGFSGLGCGTIDASIVPDLAALPEPDGWLVDALTGRHYRRATRWERRRYDWLPGTYVVEATGLRTATAGGQELAHMIVPTADGSVRHVALDRVDTSADVEMIDVRTDGGTALANWSVPRLHVYLSRVEADAEFDTLLRLHTLEDGGGVVYGVAGEHRIDGYLPTAELVLDPSLATPSAIDRGSLAPISVFQADPSTSNGWHQCGGQGFCSALCDNLGMTAPCSNEHYNPCCRPFSPGSNAGPSHACANGYDDDGDGTADHSGTLDWPQADASCQHSAHCSGGAVPIHEHRHESGIQYMYLGDIHYCSHIIHNQLKDWRAEFLKRNQQVVGGFSLPTGHAGFDGLWPNMKLRMVSAKCWSLPDVTQARTCKDGGLADCAPFHAGSHVYPYAGAGNNATNYIHPSAVTGVVRARNDVAHAVTVGLQSPINVAQVLMATASGEFMTGAESAMAAGLTAGTYSIVRATSVGNNGSSHLTTHTAVSTHELGHSLGLGHCNATASPIDGLCTVMGSTSSSGGGPCGVHQVGGCDAADGNHRFSAAEAAILYQNVRHLGDRPYHFGNDG